MGVIVGIASIDHGHPVGGGSGGSQREGYPRDPNTLHTWDHICSRSLRIQPEITWVRGEGSLGVLEDGWPSEGSVGSVLAPQPQSIDPFTKVSRIGTTSAVGHKIS